MNKFINKCNKLINWRSFCKESKIFYKMYVFLKLFLLYTAMAIYIYIYIYMAIVSWKFGHCYFLHDIFDALCGNY